MLNSWKNHYEISAVISEWPEQRLDKLLSARRLAVFIRGCLFESPLEICLPLVESIKLSDHAKEIICLDQKLGETDVVSIKLAALSSLFHHEILIDLDSFDDMQFEKVLSSLIISRDIVFPHRFGRLLYDRFTDLFDADRQDSLDAESSRKLLSGSEQGVYQVGPYLSGPMGIVRSMENRMAGPSRSVPLWHCDNIGCNHLHSVKLNDNHSALRDIADRIDSVAQNMLGPHSHWGVVI